MTKSDVGLEFHQYFLPSSFARFSLLFVGSKIIQNCVTSLMDDPITCPSLSANSLEIRPPAGSMLELTSSVLENFPWEKSVGLLLLMQLLHRKSFAIIKLRCHSFKNHLGPLPKPCSQTNSVHGAVKKNLVVRDTQKSIYFLDHMMKSRGPLVVSLMDNLRMCSRKIRTMKRQFILNPSNCII